MNSLETGDLLLFHDRPGSCCSIMNLVKLCTSSDYSHCAVVVRDPFFIDESLKGLYLLESSGFEKERDVVDDKYKFGVELISLEERLNNYEGNIYYRKIHVPRDELFHENFKTAYEMARNSSYDINIFDWIVAKSRCFCFHTQRTETFWCSALCAYIYTTIGLLPKDTPWSLVWPKDLGTEPSNNKVLWQNCAIDREVRLD